MFELTRSSIVYIVAPPNTSSGGPELLHQLCYTLNQMQINARMFYFNYRYPNRHYENPVHPNFEKYHTEYVTEIEDQENNLLIAPETITGPLKQYTKIRRCLWWLGANNYFWFKEGTANYLLEGIYHWMRYLLRFPTPLHFSEIKALPVSHMAQCRYTVHYITQKGIPQVEYLSDYINDDFIQCVADMGSMEKKDIIIYNPKRNANKRYVKWIRHRAPELQFIPIQNMSPQQVRELMGSAKVYLDLGAHPGKDRMPREAALCGCCVLTSTLGSAGFYEDVPIADEFKFIRKRGNIPQIIKKIRYIFDHYEEEAGKFSSYRDFICQEYDLFLSDVKRLFHLKAGE